MKHFGATAMLAISRVIIALLARTSLMPVKQAAKKQAAFRGPMRSPAGFQRLPDSAMQKFTTSSRLR